MLNSRLSIEVPNIGRSLELQNIYKKAESYLVLSKFITPYVGHATISPTYMKTDICGKEMPVEY